MTDKIVTIGIPAYKRREALGSVLDDIVNQGIHTVPGVEILVIDDDSQDGSYESALPYGRLPNIRVLKNDTRAGFRGNMGQLIRHCATEYLVFSCDDDFVVREGIEKLVQYLRGETAQPALISSLFYEKDQVYRANPEQVREIALGEYRICCAHLPGVAVNVRVAKAAWSRIEKYQLDERNAYPQCCLAAVFLLFGYRCIYFPAELVRTGYDSESGLVGYATLAERWRQYLFFCEFLLHLSEHIGDAEVQRKALVLLQKHKESLFLVLGSGISHETPELVTYYINGAIGHINQQ